MNMLRRFALPLLVGAASLASAQTVRGPNGHFYTLVSSPGITWTAANAAAQATLRCGQPGHLVTITSQAEQDFLVNSFGAATLFSKWIGAIQQTPSDGTTGWEWVTGEPWSYTAWAPGEPNNIFYPAFGYESAGVFWTAGRWNDGPQTYNLYGGGGYVVEWDVAPTVVIGDCDTGVPNVVVDENTLCTLGELIEECAATAKNHGDFVSCVSEVTNLAKKAGLITGAQKGRIEQCAAQAPIP